MHRELTFAPVEGLPRHPRDRSVTREGEGARPDA
jgi:hypothetical protein